ncbi:MAG: NAD(P)-binding domain-containing protein [Actinomycetota bacterium]
MRIGVLGTGGVGQTLAAKMASLGHDVMVGTRDVQAALARTEAGWGAKVLSEWHTGHPDVKLGTFAEAASHAEIVFNATAGMASLDALEAAGAENLEGKILVEGGQPTRLLGRHAADPFRVQHRRAGGADPAGLPRGEGREVPEHGEHGSDGGSGNGRRW